MIKIEVTGNSIPEVADKLLAIGHSLYSKTVVPVANGGTGAQTEADFEVPDFTIEMQDGNVVRITPVETEEVLPEVAEAAPVDPTPAPKSAPIAAGSESQPTTTEPSSTPAPAELNFDIDVAPHVLALVKEKDKATAQEILSQFGVEKASLLDPARWPELVTALKDAL
jgi:hypothetical protein